MQQGQQQVGGEGRRERRGHDLEAQHGGPPHRRSHRRTKPQARAKKLRMMSAWMRSSTDPPWREDRRRRIKEASRCATGGSRRRQDRPSRALADRRPPPSPWAAASVSAGSSPRHAAADHQHSRTPALPRLGVTLVVAALGSRGLTAAATDAARVRCRLTNRLEPDRLRHVAHDPSHRRKLGHRTRHGPRPLAARRSGHRRGAPPGPGTGMMRRFTQGTSRHAPAQQAPGRDRRRRQAPPDGHALHPCFSARSRRRARLACPTSMRRWPSSTRSATR